MNDVIGACEAERKATRAEILSHAFLLPGEIASKLITLKVTLSSSPEISESPREAKGNDYTSLEAILDDGAALIGDASSRILQELRHIRVVVFGDSCNVLPSPGESAKSGTKLDGIEESFNEFEKSVEVLHRLQETVSGEESPECKVNASLKSGVSVPYILRDLPEKISALHKEACEYIMLISEALLT